MFESLPINMPQAPHFAFVGEGLLDDSKIFSNLLADFSSQEPAQVLIITDRTIAPLYLDQLIHTLQKIADLKQIDHMIIPGGESHKTLETAQIVWTHLISHHHYRNTTIIALGGGMVGDLSGFCAACYLRGVNFIQVPTTLLAQVDAAIGGKTAVNHLLGKNLIGAFYQPRGIVCDLSVLQSLPKREFIAGLAEVIKYGLALDADFFTWIETNINAILLKQADVLKTMITRSISIKAQVVCQDEREKGNRIFLNFGHTLAHGLESVLNFSLLSHGEAVSIGMIAALSLSQTVCKLDSGVRVRAQQLLDKIGLPTRIPAGVSIVKLAHAMNMDKKNKLNNHNWVLLDRLGNSVVKSDIPTELITTVLMDLGAME